MYEINVFLRFMAVVLKKENVKDIQVTDLDKIRMTQIERYIAESEDGIKLSDSKVSALLNCIQNQDKISDIDTTEEHKVYFSIIRNGGDYDKVRV